MNEIKLQIFVRLESIKKNKKEELEAGKQGQLEIQGHLYFVNQTHLVGFYFLPLFAWSVIARA